MDDFCREAISAVLAIKGAPKPYANPVQFPKSFGRILPELDQPDLQKE
ncbi:unnamed protein product [marine sediment metagenome]|uniref:Uncharacterized protein n=1 Tax=marine sediment metagenome TaxID=412755 RepID=X1V125_9ZZZZ